MNLYLYLLLSEKINDVSDLVKQLKSLINKLNPLKDNIIEILNKIRMKIQEIFSQIKSIRVVNFDKGSSGSYSEYESADV